MGALLSTAGFQTTSFPKVVWAGTLEPWDPPISHSSGDTTGSCAQSTSLEVGHPTLESSVSGVPQQSAATGPPTSGFRTSSCPLPSPAARQSWKMQIPAALSGARDPLSDTQLRCSLPGQPLPHRPELPCREALRHFAWARGPCFTPQTTAHLLPMTTSPTEGAPRQGLICWFPPKAWHTNVC